MIRRIGYACINTELASYKIKVNRTMIKKTFIEKGFEYASKLALANIIDLKKIIEWNIKNGIKLYRMSSDMFPWCSEYEFHHLPDFNKIKCILKEIGNIINKNNIRVTFHPGHFTILASDKKEVVNAAIKDLNQHAQIMDMMGLPLNHYSKINIHIGSIKGGKIEAMNRFCNAFQQLKPNVKVRLTIENDDKPSMFTVKDLMYVHNKIGIPIVFDFHHYDCNPGNMSKKESFKLAISTWPKGIIPIVHYSNSKKLYEDKSVKITAHADYIYEKMPDYGYNIDVMLEAKQKEQAVIKYIKDYF